ncbi:putative Fungal N-terminal domain-containing protein [Seiridium cardinale]|uniref:Fungal N-terminal domain-containing protein n=1 Tax=Seiridium cardinale TaxID=138064 RepID=A0ABR2Y341_9PEZI
MIDPLSFVASAAGVITFAAQTARTLVTLTSEIRDAPEIFHVRRDIQSLSAVLQTVQDVCTKANMQPEDQALVESLTAYVELCETTMKEIKESLQPFSDKGSAKRSPLRRIGWMLRKDEINGLRERLQEGKASLNLTILALKGYGPFMTLCGSEEIKAEVNKVYSQLVVEFRSTDNGTRIRRRVEDDLSSTSNFGTGADLPLRRYFQGLPDDSRLLEVPDNNRVLSWEAPTASLVDAVRQRDRGLVSQLVSNGASLSERSLEGYTVLHYCAIYNNDEIAEILISHGADINTRDNQLRSPLQVALVSESAKVAALFIQSNCFLGDSVSAIYSVVKRAEEVPDVIDILKALAIHLNKAPHGPYLIQQAIGRNDTRILRLLCEAGLDVNIKDTHGLPPLCHAMLQKRDEAFRILIQHGADVDYFSGSETEGKLDESISWHREVKDRFGHGVMPLSVTMGPPCNPACTKLVLDRGAYPNYVFPSNGGILLVSVCAPVFFKSAKLLVEYGARVNHRNRDGHSSPYCASRCGNPELLRLLLEHGGDVNITDTGDCTPLHLAAKDGKVDIARIVLEHGADTSLRNSDDETAAEVARRHKNLEIVE